MIQLTPRLQAVADCVSTGSVIADIGTDHAYIPAYLIERGIIERAFACDINEGPLANARKTAANHQIVGIEFVLSNGLEALEDKRFDEIVIAGMGGELIAEIMTNSPFCRDVQYRFILQPMTKADYLRRYLYANGFQILQETLAAEKDKLYNIMKVQYTAREQQISEAFALLGPKSNHALFEQKRRREISRLKKIALSLQNKENSVEQRQQMLALIREIEVY